MNLIRQRMSSDKAASNTVETIIIIALAVFAALALFTFILKPVQNSSENLGDGLDTWINDLLKGQGDDTPAFDAGKVYSTAKPDAN